MVRENVNQLHSNQEELDYSNSLRESVEISLSRSSGGYTSQSLSFIDRTILEVEFVYEYLARVTIFTPNGELVKIERPN